MKLLVFDLDGTLVDTKLNIAQAVNETFTKKNFDTIPVDKVASFVGNGSKRLLEECFLYHNISENNEKESISKSFFDYYYENVTSCTSVFKEVEEVLRRLSEHKLVILTNKPSRMAQKLVQFLHLDTYFLELIGGDEVELLKPNPHYLQYFQKKYPAEKTIMIGDSRVDVETAKNADVMSIAITHGFGTLKELTTADFIVNSFLELEQIIKEKS